MLQYLTRLMSVLVVFVLLNLILPHRAYAYLDLGTGSYIFQLIIGLLFGASVYIKIYWKNVKTFFTNLFSKKKDSQNA